MPLAAYKKKRDFRRTAEPAPAPVKRARKGAKQPSFVIQKHDATRLHYDLRLEMDGVLKSWAVPKGMPLKTGDRRLAVEVEDHPLEYAKFEGVIPKGEYGGGTVIVWDRGVYLGEEDALSAWKKGRIHFALSGEKLTGEWTLVRTRQAENHWLVMKTGKSHRAISTKEDGASALSGRTLAEVAAENGENPARKRTTGAGAKKAKPSGGGKSAAPSGNMPEFVEPMYAVLEDAPPAEGEWIYEIKFDGYRALGFRDENGARLMSRNRLDWTRKYAVVTEALAGLPAGDFIVDGEIAALDEEGRPDFQLLQDFARQDAPLAFYLFDLLRENGEDLTGLPLTERRRRLKKLLVKAKAPLRFSTALEGDAGELLEHAGRTGFEGLIGKRADSLYESGRRSGAWIKLKCVKAQEFVIGGFTPPQGARKHLGALLVGYRKGDVFRFAGKVGTGFNTAACRELKELLTPLIQEKPPFAGVPRTAETRRAHWTEPRLVCQIKFTEWTADGMLRHPVFLGLREDKRPEEVRREEA